MPAHIILGVALACFVTMPVVITSIDAAKQSREKRRNDPDCPSDYILVKEKVKSKFRSGKSKIKRFFGKAEKTGREKWEKHIQRQQEKSEVYENMRREKMESYTIARKRIRTFGVVCNCQDC